VFSFIFRIVYVLACFLQYDVSEHDSIAQQLRHWNYLFLAARREHAIPCRAKCYHIKLSRAVGRSHECKSQHSERLIPGPKSMDEAQNRSGPFNYLEFPTSSDPQLQRFCLERNVV
jgi:hypothetical protein